MKKENFYSIKLKSENLFLSEIYPIRFTDKSQAKKYESICGAYTDFEKISKNYPECEIVISEQN